MSVDSNVFVAQVRDTFGKSATKLLAKAHFVPASIYLNTGEVLHISIPVKDLNKAVENYRFLNTVFHIECMGKKHAALPKEIDFHPITEAILHVEFKELPKSGNVDVLVPVAVVNQAKSVGIKAGGKLNLPMHNIIVNCNPEKIPEKIVIDIEQFGVGRALFTNSLKTDGSYTFPKNTFILSILGRGKKDKGDDATAVVAAPEATKQSAAKPAAPAAKKK